MIKTKNIINREDMLELTRRMTLTRNSVTRIAGCYADREGIFDGSFKCKLDIENPVIRINTAFKGCSSLEKISVLPRIYHN